MSPLVLILLRSEGRCTVGTDACDKQVHCVLLHQQPDGYDKPIGCCSQSLNAAETVYDTTHRECLAVVWAALIMRLYLEDLHFTIRIDHEALKRILNLVDASGKLPQWRPRVSKFEYNIIH